MRKGDAPGPEVNADWNQDWLCYIKLLGVWYRQSMLTRYLFQLGTKDKSEQKKHKDYYTSNFVNKYTQNNSECYKVPESNTDQFRNSFFVKTTSDWNCLSDDHIRAETVNSFKTAVHSYVTSQ